MLGEEAPSGQVAIDLPPWFMTAVEGPLFEGRFRMQIDSGRLRMHEVIIVLATIKSHRRLFRLTTQLCFLTVSETLENPLILRRFLNFLLLEHHK